jgi:hypothetical protein
MAYTQDIPQPSDIPSQSQAQILANFQAINSSTEGFGLDHVQFDAVSDKGKHKQSTYIEQSVDPVTAANEMALYSKDDGSGNTRLFIAPESAAPIFQLTGATPSVSTSGSTFLPGGLILKYGIKNTPVNNTVITFSSAFPNNVYSIILTPVKSDNTSRSMYVKTGTAAVTGFTIQTDSGTFTSVYYLAIGN